MEQKTIITLAVVGGVVVTAYMLIKAHKVAAPAAAVNPNPNGRSSQGPASITNDIQSYANLGTSAISAIRGLVGVVDPSAPADAGVDETQI